MDHLFEKIARSVYDYIGCSWAFHKPCMAWAQEYSTVAAVVDDIEYLAAYFYDSSILVPAHGSVFGNVHPEVDMHQ